MAAAWEKWWKNDGREAASDGPLRIGKGIVISDLIGEWEEREKKIECKREEREKKEKE